MYYSVLSLGTFLCQLIYLTTATTELPDYQTKLDTRHFIRIPVFGDKIRPHISKKIYPTTYRPDSIVDVYPTTYRPSNGVKFLPTTYKPPVYRKVSEPLLSSYDLKNKNYERKSIEKTPKKYQFSDKKVPKKYQSQLHSQKYDKHSVKQLDLEKPLPSKYSFVEYSKDDVRPVKYSDNKNRRRGSPKKYYVFKKNAKQNKNEPKSSRTQQVAIFAAKNLHPSESKGYKSHKGHGDYKPKGYSYHKGAKAGHHASAGHKENKGGFQETGYDGNHKGHHEKKGQGAYHDKGKSNYKGGDHKESYHQDHNLNKKGGKGHHYGDKGYHNKGAKDKGFKNLHHKTVYAYSQDYYSDTDNKKYHNLHDDFDKYFEAHKNNNNKGGFFEGDFYGDKFGKHGHHDYGHFYDNHGGHKGGYGHKGYHDHQQEYGNKGSHDKHYGDKHHNHGY